MKYFYDGKFLLKDEIKIDILSPTTQYGLNVFEGIRGYYNKNSNCLVLIDLNSHIKRLLQSANFLNIQHDYTFENIQNTINDLIKVNRVNHGVYIKIVLLFSDQGSWNTNQKASIFIAIFDNKDFNPQKKSLRSKISSWERINSRSLPPRIKSGANYINSRLAQLEVLRDGYDMAIFLDNQGFLSEAPGSCLFLVKDESFYTPSLTSSVLESITRKIVIYIIENVLGKKCYVQSLDRIDFYQSDEAFLCGTAIELTRIESIDHIQFTNHELFSQLAEEFYKFTKGDLDIPFQTSIKCNY